MPAALPMTRLRRLGALCLPVVIAACGSTVQVASGVGPGTAPVGVVADDGLGLPGAGTETSATAVGISQAATSGSTGSGAAPSTPAGRPAGATTPVGPGATTPTAAGTPAPGAAGSPGADVAMGRGVTADTITLAVLYLEGAEAVASTFGVEGLATGDAAAQTRAIVEAINAEGGIAGRTVEVHYEAIDTATAVNNPENAAAAACASLTQDREVFAVVSYVNTQASFNSCLAQGGTILVDNASGVDAPQYAGGLAGYFYAPGDFILDRLMAAEMTRLIDSGWLTPDRVAGLHYTDTPARRQVVEDVVKPLLAARGITVAEEAAVTPGTAGLSQYGNIALRFRAAGVDRVLNIGHSPLFLMQQAESQGYYPAYSVDSLLGPAALLQGAAPPRQLRDAAGIGWQPWSDVDAARNPGPVSDAEARCLAIMDASGQRSTASTTTLFQLMLCDSLFFLDAALSAAPALTVDGLAAGARTLGPGTHAASVTFATDLRSGRPDGAAAVRDLRYLEDCGCFSYTSEPIAL